MSAGSSSAEDATVAIVGDSIVTPPRRGNAAQATVAGTRIGRYLVINELGRGGMGVVVHAYDPKLQREVALKLVRADRNAGPARGRLIREARAMAQLSHPNVVAVYDVELDLDFRDGDEGVVIAMEYVAGTTLQAWLESAVRSRRDIVRALVAAGRGLAAAHTEELLHRDFKLDNVLIGHDGRVRVTDFGLARATHQLVSGDASNSGGAPSPETSDVTEAGTVVGTPRYMAPEQMVGEVLDARSDQYAFCVASWRALTGGWPFDAKRYEDLLPIKRTGPPTWPGASGVARHVGDALRRGLEADPSARWPSMPALLDEIERDPSRARRRALVAVAAGFAVVAVVAGRQLMHAHEVTACADEGAAIREHWNDARIAAITTAFDATGIPYAADTWARARPRIDAYVDAWAEARTSACTAADIEHSLEPRLAVGLRSCLDDQQERLGALLTELAAPDAAAVQRAGRATASLPTVDACAEVANMQRWSETPEDSSTHDAARAVRVALSRADAARMLGHHERAWVHVASARDQALASEWAPLVAETELAAGRIHTALGRYEEARISLENAFATGGGAGHDDVALAAASSLVSLVGSTLARQSEGLQWSAVARMLVTRLGLSNEIAEARLLIDIGDVQMDQAAYADALDHYADALAILEQQLGPQHLEVASVLRDAGFVRYAQGELAPARADLERSVATFEFALGPEHPSVAGALETLADVLRTQGEVTRALEIEERALTIYEAAFGPEHPSVGAVLSGLGSTQLHMGDIDGALASQTRALTIFEKNVGKDHPNVAATLVNLGAILLDRHEYARARESYERAMAIFETTLGRDHINVATPLEGIGRSHLAEGSITLAIAAFERSLVLREGGEASPGEVARARFDLAAASWEIASERARARAMASAATTAFRETGGNPEELQRMQTWLAAHR